MKQVLVSIARTIPGLLEHSAFHVSLAGWPAAAAVLVVGATIVATTMILAGGTSPEPAN